MKRPYTLAGRAGFVFLVVVANFLVDRITKIWAVEFLQGNPPQGYWGNFVVFQYAENNGAFLSLGAGWPDLVKAIVLLVLPMGLCIVAIGYCVWKEEDKFRAALIASVATGGIANLYDRLFHSFHVVDFLNFGVGGLRTGILNVADMSVTFGVILLVLHQYRQDKKKRGVEERKAP